MFQSDAGTHHGAQPICCAVHRYTMSDMYLSSTNANMVPLTQQATNPAETFFCNLFLRRDLQPKASSRPQSVLSRIPPNVGLVSMPRMFAASPHPTTGCGVDNRARGCSPTSVERIYTARVHK